ncbi:MAG: mandelate racemase/muconate lactonizing enzyme family protein [Candidatus Bathyarchaeia archaeon]
MKITDVKTAILRGNFEFLLVRIDTDEEVCGYGECFPWPKFRETASMVRELKPALIGEQAFPVERLIRKMGLGPWRSDTRIAALSGVETALWDLAGKAVGQPVHRLMGGKLRDKVPIYCDSHSGRPISARSDYELDAEHYTPEAYAANAKRIRSLGFSFIKFDLGAGYAAAAGPRAIAGQGWLRHLTSVGLRYMVDVVAALRGAVGYETELALDCGQFSTGDAVKFGNAVEEYELAWLEDMVRSVDDYVTVTRAIRTPTLTGEHLQTRYGFKELLERRGIRVAAPDMSFCGGLLEGKKVAEMAEMNQIMVAPHNCCTPIGTMGAVHAASTMPNLIAVEFHSVAVPWWNSLVKGGKPLIQNGYIELTDKPGLGIEVDEQEARKHLWEGEAFFE